MDDEVRGWTDEWDGVAQSEAARCSGAFARAPGSTRLGSDTSHAASGVFSARATCKLQHSCKTSGWAPVYRLRSGSIRKKIIGHGMRAVVARVAFSKHLWRPWRAFSLLKQQARQHSGGVLFHPLIEQGRNLLAEIGGMCQTRQFKTLEGVPGSREQELPRWLGRAGGHRPPFWGRCER
jgi:hypothetical protein